MLKNVLAQTMTAEELNQINADQDELFRDRLINYFKEKSEKSCRLMGELGIYLQSFLFFISFSSLLSIINLLNKLQLRDSWNRPSIQDLGLYFSWTYPSKYFHLFSSMAIISWFHSYSLARKIMAKARNVNGTLSTLLSTHLEQ